MKRKKTMKKMTLGISSGSLLKPTLALLNKLGIRVLMNGRNFIAEVRGSNLFSSAIIMRPNDLPLALKNGVVDAIFTGYDMLAESGLGKELCVIQALTYSKKSRLPARVVLFCREDDSDKIEDAENILVSSEYIFLARTVFKKAKIIFSTGSTEIKLAVKKFGFRYGICVTETGKSLEDNGLKILRTLLISPVVFVAREESGEMKIMGEMLAGALSAELYQLVKFNADSGNKDKLVAIIPALESPTISTLADGAMAIETVVLKSAMSDTIMAIKKNGGRKIVIQDINISV
jgi:ATP phosphoribosyltransferase